MGGTGSGKGHGKGKRIGSSLAINPHVTMAHEARVEQKDMRSNFEEHVGTNVTVTVSSLYFSRHIAALGCITSNEFGTLPPSHNDFPRITIWHSSEAYPAMSNQLPALAERGEAHV